MRFLLVVTEVELDRVKRHVRKLGFLLGESPPPRAGLALLSVEGTSRLADLLLAERPPGLLSLGPDGPLELL